MNYFTILMLNSYLKSVKFIDTTERKDSIDQRSIDSYNAAIETRHCRSDTHRNSIDELSHQSARCKTIIGISLVLALAICRSGMAQFGRNLYTQGNFTSSSLVTWFSRSSVIFFFPMVATVMTFFGHSYRETYREGCKILGKNEFSSKDAIKKIFPLTTMAIAATYFNFYALSLTSATNVTAVTSTAAAFVYVMSLIWLKEPFIMIRMLAVCMSIVGVILIGYSEGFESFGGIGILLATASAICSALYRVFTKKLIGQGSVTQASFFMCNLGLQTFLVYWIPTAVLVSNNVEVIEPVKFPWTAFLLTGLAGFGFSTLMCVGIAVTYPIYISMGPLLAIPLNALMDAYIENIFFDVLKILGTLAVIVGFLILTMPVAIVQSFSLKLRSLIVNSLCV